MSNSIKYIKSFDGMRGIGALMIILYHFPAKYFTISHGWEFMQLFFVMSGYLITLVLLEDKSKYNFKNYAFFFYVKRILRLFPLYFLYLIFWIFIYLFFKNNLLLKIGAEDVVNHATYLFTYTFNYMSLVNFLISTDYHSTTITTHLWTLSVEEQFYLVFPFLVYFLKKETLKKVVLAAIVMAPIFRIIFYFVLKDMNPGDVAWVSQNLIRLPLAQMDSIAIGAAIALFNFSWIKNPVKLFWIITILLFVIYSANMAYVYFIEGSSYFEITYGKKLAENWMTHNFLFSYIITLVNFWCMMALFCVTKGYNLKWLLENKILVFLGKLSYGIYIMHLPIMFFCGILLNVFPFIKNHQHHFLVEGFSFTFFMTILVLISYITFHYFEKKFINMRHRIYIPKTKTDTQ